MASPRRKLVTAAELEDLTSVKRKTLYEWASAGQIPHYRFGGRCASTWRRC